MQNFEMSSKVVVAGGGNSPPGPFMRHSASFPPRAEGPATTNVGQRQRFAGRPMER